MRIGVLTGGGDAPGLNAAIRAVVMRAHALGHEVFGIADGWAGLLGENLPRPLGVREVAGILGDGGTILGTSRTDPRKEEASRRGVLGSIRRAELDALVAIGGNDTLGVANWLHEQGVRVVGVPKTVDNDLSETEFCIGFDTAITVVADALDRLRTTASAHHRVVVVEAMGRDTGWVAAFGGLAGGADLILIPEIPVTSDDVVRTMKRRRAMGDPDILVVVSEAVEIKGLEAETAVDRDAFGHVRLDQRAIGAILARDIEQRTGLEARQVVLGHLQRGGSPTAIDRLRATRFGNAAVDLVEAGRSGVLPVQRAGRIETATLADAVRETRRLSDDYIELVRRFAGLLP
ncbi:MAG: ATP-dependent 6-phosphofructokinase [Chloroflexi bacterium]|nr:MAG: ATP-dependent 6-phosphofructokinase [Chloroflexota bacterium]